MPKYDPKTANAKYISNLLHNIKWLRREFGVSKAEMARLLGVGVSTVDKIEQDELPPRMNVEVLFNLEHQFGFRACELIREQFGE